MKILKKKTNKEVVISENTVSELLRMGPQSPSHLPQRALSVATHQRRAAVMSQLQTAGEAGNLLFWCAT